MTVYVDDRESTQKWIERLRLDFDEAFQSDKAEIYNAVFSVAREHEEELIDKLGDDAGDGR